MPYVRTKLTPTEAETEAWARAHLGQLGLRRGRRFRGGKCVFDPAAEEARRALSGVASKLAAAVATPVVPASRSILLPKLSTKKNPDHALHDAIGACDRLLGRRRR